MQVREGRMIPESPRPVHDTYDTACWWASFYPRSYLRMWNRLGDPFYRAKSSGDHGKETGISLLEDERINMI